jgi:hypothetical protein
VEGAAWDRFGEKAAFLGDYSAGSRRNPGFGLGVKKNEPRTGGAKDAKGVKEQSGGKLESGAKARASENRAFTG